MESNRFDSLTRSLSSRRATLTSLLGGVAALLGIAGVEEAAAHDPTPHCRRLADPKKRRACLRRARAHIRRRHTCRPQPKAVTCTGRCNIKVRNNCRTTVACSCPRGKLCLANKVCNRFCVTPGTGANPAGDCPLGCTCGFPTIDDPAVLHCTSVGFTCQDLNLEVCTSTSQCPAGQFCTPDLCGLSGVCIPRCAR